MICFDEERILAEVTLSVFDSIIGFFRSLRSEGMAGDGVLSGRLGFAVRVLGCFGIEARWWFSSGVLTLTGDSMVIRIVDDRLCEGDSGR